MLFGKAVRLGGEQHAVDVAHNIIAPAERRVARVGPVGAGTIAALVGAAFHRRRIVGPRMAVDEFEHPRDVRVARHGHPRVLPDGVQHAVRQEVATAQRLQLLRQRIRQLLRLRFAAKDTAQQFV
ncbi:hypothetical protein NRS6194_04168 [Bacillus subtilis]|nr:hypothetical protein NRS6194_04168 [Bacillus subtilis]